MKLLIEIDEEFVKTLKCFNDKDLGDYHRAIKHGTPLPKGHGRLIDVSELLTTTEISEDGSEMTYVTYTEIEQAPTIIEADKTESEDKV